MTRASPLMSDLPSVLDGDITRLKQGMTIVIVPAIAFYSWASINLC